MNEWEAAKSRVACFVKQLMASSLAGGRRHFNEWVVSHNIVIKIGQHKK